MAYPPLSALMREAYWRSINPSAAGWERIVTGSGTDGAGGQINERRLFTGTTHGSSILIRTSEDGIWCAHSDMDWSRLVVVHTWCDWLQGGYFTSRVTLGKQHSIEIGPLPHKGIGFMGCLGAVLSGVYGEVHDGTSLTRVDLGVAASTRMLVSIVSLGNGTVFFLVNGALKGSATHGPVGPAVGLPGQNVLQAEIVDDQAGDGGNSQFSLSHFNIYVGPDL